MLRQSTAHSVYRLLRLQRSASESVETLVRMAFIVSLIGSRAVAVPQAGFPRQRLEIIELSYKSRGVNLYINLFCRIFGGLGRATDERLNTFSTFFP